MIALGRRHFLLGSLGGAAWACDTSDEVRLGQSLPPPDRPAGLPISPEVELLIAYFGPRQVESAAELGRIHREALGLVEWASARDALRARAAELLSAPLAQGVEQLRFWVASDFESGALQSVGGWQLAALEADLAGWASEMLEARLRLLDGGVDASVARDAGRDTVSGE